VTAISFPRHQPKINESVIYRGKDIRKIEDAEALRAIIVEQQKRIEQWADTARESLEVRRVEV